MSSAAAEPSGVGRASALLASGTLVSRILGFISLTILAQTIGTQGSGADTFALANRLPNNIYAIVAGGVLSAVLVPQIVRAGVQSDGGQRFINRIITLGFVVFVTAAALATLAAPALVSLYAQSAGDTGRGFTDAEFALATAFAYWCLPQILFYALYSLFGEVLNARRMFGPFTWAPAVNNVVVIAGLIAFNLIFGGRDVTDTQSWTPGMIVLISATATLGVAVQASVLLLFWRKAGLRYRPEFRWHGVGLGRVGTAAVWVFGMVVVTQLAGIVQTRVASLAGGVDASIAVLQYSWLIFMLPHSIVTVSIVTAYFTRMSGHARDSDMDALKQDISAAVRRIGLVMVFAAAGLVVLAYPFAAVFTREGFDETAAMAHVLIAFLIGLVPFTLLFVMQRIFYSLEDTRTPFLLQVFQATLFIAGALLVAQLPVGLIAVGLAAVTTIAISLQTALAAVILRRRLQGIGARRIIRQYLVFLLAMLPASGAGVLAVSALGGFSGGFAVSGIGPALATMVMVGAGMLLVYVATLALFRTEELRDFAAPLLARLRRR